MVNKWNKIFFYQNRYHDKWKNLDPNVTIAVFSHAVDAV